MEKCKLSMNSSIICHSDKNIFLVLFKMCQWSQFYTSENTRDFYEVIDFTSHSCSMASFKLMFSEVHKLVLTASCWSQQSGFNRVLDMLEMKGFGKSKIQGSKSEQGHHSLEWPALFLVQSAVLRWLNLEIGSWKAAVYEIETNTHWCHLALKGPL